MTLRPYRRVRLASWLSGRYCLQIMRLVFFRSDTTTVRLMLALCSGAYATLLMVPEVANGIRHAVLFVVPQLAEHVKASEAPSTFARPAYALMALWPGGVWTWVVLFWAHCLGVHWRAIVPKESIPWALAVNGLGVFVWAYSTLSLAVSLGTLLPTSAMECVLTCGSLWILVRTGTNLEIVTA